VRNDAVVHAIRHLPGQVIASALRGSPRLDASDVRQEFLSWASGQRDEYDSWQAAWNAWTGASQSRPGQVRLHVMCPTCRGRMFDIRTGTSRPCPTCMARKRVWLNATALWQPLPET